MNLCHHIKDWQNLTIQRDPNNGRVLFWNPTLLEVFKAWLAGSLKNLTWWKMTLLIAEHGELDNLYGPFQSRPFDSMTPQKQHRNFWTEVWHLIETLPLSSKMRFFFFFLNSGCGCSDRKKTSRHTSQQMLPNNIYTNKTVYENPTDYARLRFHKARSVSF